MQISNLRVNNVFLSIYKRNLTLVLINEALSYEGIRRTGGTAPTFLISAVEVSDGLHALVALPPGISPAIPIE
jgi:hypothetical protein